MPVRHPLRTLLIVAAAVWAFMAVLIAAWLAGR
jgi:hypothetical protein